MPGTHRDGGFTRMDPEHAIGLKAGRHLSGGMQELPGESSGLAETICARESAGHGAHRV